MLEAVFTRIARWPLGGIAVAVMAVLARWERNPRQLGFEAAWSSIAMVALLALLLTALLRIACGSWTRAGIAAALVAIYLFHAPELLGLINAAHATEVLLHISALVLLSLVWWSLPKALGKFEAIAGRLNLVFLFVLLATAVPIAVTQIQFEQHRSVALERLGELEGKADANSPDVWHIVFDRYAGRDTLRTQYGYDNGPFIEALRQRGFALREPAWSNYQRTAHSIASTMNGTLLDPLSAPMAAKPGDWVPIYRAMRENAAIRLFNRMGYQTVFAGSWWEPTRYSRSAAVSIRIRALPQLARVTLERSALGFWLRGRAVPWLDGRSDQCFRVNEKFRRLRELSKSPSAKYVFAHFLVPHPPYVLNADGTCRSRERALEASRSENYIAQIEFANREALALVDAILDGPRPAMIVIHSDEGPWPAPYIGNEHGLGTDPVAVPWTQLTPAQLHEKMGILLAVRDPDGQAPRTMPASPVQIYPALLRDHFGSQQAMPLSRHFVFEKGNALYQFLEIGDQLTEP